MDNFINNYELILEYFAKICAYTIEAIGIIVIVYGVFKTLYYLIFDHSPNKAHKAKMTLGDSLALALQFKMGAEIIKTAIVKDLMELLVLGIVVLLRVILAILVHWELKTEKNEDAQEEKLSLFKKRKKVVENKANEPQPTKEENQDTSK